jgi:hypothetical protein
VWTALTHFLDACNDLNESPLLKNLVAKSSLYCFVMMT